MSWKPRETTKHEKIIGELQHYLAQNDLPFLCAECEGNASVNIAYRCFYCKMYICEKCAENHFKKEPQ